MPLLSCSSAALLWPFAKCGVKLGEKRDTLVWSLPVVVQLQQGAACARALPSTVGTEDLVPVSSKQGEQKSSLCLVFWESSEFFLHLSRRNRSGEILERNWRKWKQENVGEKLEGKHLK